jgi:hypothetical protein
VTPGDGGEEIRGKEGRGTERIRPHDVVMIIQDIHKGRGSLEGRVNPEERRGGQCGGRNSIQKISSLLK